MLISTLAALVISAQPAPVRCRPALEITGRAVLGPSGSDLSQQRLTLTARPNCPMQLVRVKTRSGAVIPPLGYWRIGGGYPLRISYWVIRGATAEWRVAPNVWVPIPLGVAK
ncbi:hypothetical protein [Deinococcus fonticola]|uniref:hypothetical protein n=1 Tax=Deinococcus fonticola TaxID=2528713 RepID=UPI001074BFD5|nr:hypothetical protein [Deinococcus fonticola]